MPSSNSVNEMWGPYLVSFNGTGIEAVVMKNYWDCHGAEPSSCSNEEDFTYAKPYGWIEWEHYVASAYDGNFVWQNGGQFGTPMAMPGAWLGYGAPAVLPDWCLTPSLYAQPRTATPARGWPGRAVAR